MTEALKQVDSWSRTFLGMRATTAAVIVALFSIAGAAAAVLFPKFEATALLQFPEAQKPGPATEQPRSIDPNANVIELAAYKRVAASYDSAPQLQAYLEASGVAASAGAARLLRQAENPAFWMRAAAPVLPFSRRDQREFGDIKDAPGTTMLGLELTASARTAAVAQEMVELLAGYFINAVVRERVRAWTLAGKVDAQSQEKIVRADILKAELDIELYSRRIDDMKVMLARYPDASRMDSRQIVSVNPNEGGERYLSPLAQIVGAESAITQRREFMRRWQRELKQKSILADFYVKAESTVNRELIVTRLLPELRRIAEKTFAHADAKQEWNQEAALRVNGAIDNFEVMSGQFGVRNGIRVGAAETRNLLRLVLVGLSAGLALLGVIAFLRITIRSSGRDGQAPVDGAF